MRGFEEDAKFHNPSITGIVNILISYSDSILEKGYKEDSSVNICHFLFKRNSSPESDDFYIDGLWNEHLYDTMEYFYHMVSRYQSPYMDMKMQLVFEKYKQKKLKYGKNKLDVELWR